MPHSVSQSALVGTGITGLDTVLHGGLPRGRIYLVEGFPGVGKTTLGLQFLLEGIRAGERAMMVSLIETAGELADVAASHRWSLDGIHFMNLPAKLKFSATQMQTVFPPAEVEFGELADAIFKAIETFKPNRLLIDSISQLAMLTDNWQQMRSSVLSTRDLIHTLGITTLITSSKVESQVSELDTIVHGTITLKVNEPDYGQISRELIVKKIRGHKYLSGNHNFRINTGGLEVFTWRQVAHDSQQDKWHLLSSGNKELDELLGGGLEEGTTCLISGTTGAGKSTIASLYVQAAARRGENSVILCFDERKETFLRRSASLNLEIPTFIEQGLVDLQQIDAGQISPGEFVQMVAGAVEKTDAKVVVIDSLSGYCNAMPGENNLMRQLHELLAYLSGIGVLTIMIMTKSRTSGISETEIDSSYIADTFIVLRHFEALGTLRRCVAVVKKRHGIHEHTIREFKIVTGGCKVGQPLKEFSGILTGTPQYIGKVEKLMEIES